jgi:2-hydroxycyclohexanecarboxyl-CoA dehydrogenase
MVDRVLEGQTAIVTGAGMGIGRGCALRLAAGGAAVAVIDINPEAANETVALITADGGKAVPVQADVTDAAQVERSVREAVAELGEPSILVNNAGGGTARAWVTDIPVEAWDLVFARNVRAAYLYCQQVLPFMIERRYGRIVSIASGAGVRPNPQASPYSAAKAGVISLMKSVAGEVATRGITANSVCPGTVDTPGTRRGIGDRDVLLQTVMTSKVANPMHVVLEPADIAEAVAFLASPGARYITGQALHVNAGAIMP